MSKILIKLKEKKDNKFVYNYYKQLINNPKFMREISQLRKEAITGNIHAIPIGKA